MAQKESPDLTLVDVIDKLVKYLHPLQSVVSEKQMYNRLYDFLNFEANDGEKKFINKIIGTQAAEIMKKVTESNTKQSPTGRLFRAKELAQALSINL